MGVRLDVTGSPHPATRTNEGRKGWESSFVRGQKKTEQRPKVRPEFGMTNKMGRTPLGGRLPWVHPPDLPRVRNHIQSTVGGKGTLRSQRITYGTPSFFRIPISFDLSVRKDYDPPQTNFIFFED